MVEYFLRNFPPDMRGWRNRQTRTFEVRVVYTMGVQVPSLSPSLFIQLFKQRLLVAFSCKR